MPARPSAGASPMPLRLLAAAFLLAGCSEEPAPPAPQAKIEEPSPPPAPRSVPEPRAGGERAPAGSGAEASADVLRSYYERIGAGDYNGAYALRERSEGAATAEEFAANFELHAEHRATVGAPSRVAEAGGWQYVEVPVQIYGRLKSGKPMASAGTMTLRRRKAEPNAPWRIYTSR